MAEYRLRRGAAVATAATLALAAACWAFTVWRMSGMDMGTATQLGSFPVFGVVWLSMMAAMMLPGAAPAVARLAGTDGGARAVPLFLVAYLTVWALVGLLVYAVYRPHGPLAAGVLVIVAGVYELTPLKRHCRRCCQQRMRSGYEYGLCCVGAGIGLMAVLVALGAMSITWMCVVTVLSVGQKLLPVRASLDVPLAVALVGLGTLVVLAPSAVPGLTTAM